MQRSGWLRNAAFMRQRRILSCAAQKQALMDLLVLSRYADHNLASAADNCVQRPLEPVAVGSQGGRSMVTPTPLARIFRSRRSRRRQSALISEEEKLAPTDVGGYTLRPCPPQGEVSGLELTRHLEFSSL